MLCVCVCVCFREEDDARCESLGSGREDVAVFSSDFYELRLGFDGLDISFQV